MLIDWCCKLQGEQASNWPKSRQSGGARVGGGRRRVGIGRKGADWLGTLFEGEGARGGGRSLELLRLGLGLGWAGLGLATGDSGRVEETD